MTTGRLLQLRILLVRGCLITSIFLCVWCDVVSQTESDTHNINWRDRFSQLKASIHLLTQSCGQISCHGKPVERTHEIGLEMISLVLHWFPVASDRVTRLSPKVDRGFKSDWKCINRQRHIESNLNSFQGQYRRDQSFEKKKCLMFVYGLFYVNLCRD